MRSDYLPERGHYAVLAKFFFRADLIERCGALFDAISGVTDAALLQNFLQLPVFAKRSVDGEECQIHITGQFEILVPYIDLENVGSERSQRLCHPAPGCERDVALRARTTHQDCNFFRQFHRTSSLDVPANGRVLSRRPVLLFMLSGAQRSRRISNFKKPTGRTITRDSAASFRFALFRSE